MPADGPTPSPVASPAVSCNELVVRYDERIAVNRVSLHAARGEVLCILGPNGAGKTSTIECLEGYRRPASGSASVLGLDPWADHAAVVGKIGVMLQRGGLYPMLAAGRALRLFASYYEDPEDPESLLDLVRLRHVERTPWRHLSGGEQARLSLALALIGKPEVVFLDEPTAGVDPEGRLAVREVIAGLRDRGVCVLLTTHELTEAERLADRVMILHRGVVAAEGTPETLAATAGRTRAGTAPAAGTRTVGVSTGDGMGGTGTGAGAGADGANGAADGSALTVDAAVAEGEAIAFGAAPGLDTGALGAAVGTAVTEESPGRYRAAAPPGAAAAGLVAGITAWLADRGLTLHDLRVGRSLEEAYLDVVGTAGSQDGSEGDATPARRGRGGRGRRSDSAQGRSRRDRGRRDRSGASNGSAR